MENKENYLKILTDTKGKLNEMDLGEKLGLTENETRRIISMLLAEHKIHYSVNGACNYSLIKRGRNR